MAFYTDFAVTNPSGMHTFDGVAFSGLGTGYTVTVTSQTPDGVLVTVRKSGVIVIKDALVHKNGRNGPMDLSKDTIVLYVSDLAQLPADMQASIYPYEQVPGGRRP